MRTFYSLFLLLALSVTLSASEYRGFLLTRDGIQLTGYFNLIQYSATGNYITFTNDFGDIYSIHPMLVRGFGFSKDGTSFRYISRFHNGQWYFLREEVYGRTLRLYRLPDNDNNWVDDSLLKLYTNPPPTFYIGYGEGKLLPVPRVGFKRTMRDFLATASPELARKIGKKGYRYRDLYAIIGQVNELTGRQRRRL